MRLPAGGWRLAPDGLPAPTSPRQVRELQAMLHEVDIQAVVSD